jgi:hypothetical protein
MYFQKVITKVPHQDRRNRNVVDDFFVMDVNVWVAADALGYLQADPQTMNRLIRWSNSPESKEYVLLISLDGKYGVIALTESVDKPTGDSQVFLMENGYFADIDEIRKVVNGAMANDPNFAEKVNFKPAQRSIPERVTLENAPARFNVEEMPREIGGVNSVLENATDDSLVWLALIGANNGEGFTPNFNAEVKSELSMRIHKKMNFLATFFPLDSVTEREIEARASRAKRSLATFEAKFPANQPASLEEVSRYASRLSTDRLAELTIVRYYTERGFDEKLKFLAAELQERLSHGWE